MAGGGFDRLLLPRGQRLHISGADLIRQPVRLREALNESRVRFPGPPTESVLEMADDQLAIAPGDQPMKQNDRVAPAGNADKITTVVRQNRAALPSPIVGSGRFMAWPRGSRVRRARENAA